MLKRRASALLGAIAFALIGCGAGARPATKQSVAVARVEPRAAEPVRPVIGRKEIALLPLAEALPTYREWVLDEDPTYATEAIAQLAWARDAASVPSIAKSVSHRGVRLTAAQALAELGDGRAKPELLQALKDASEPAERSAIVWALVVLGEPSVLDEAVQQYAAGALEKVTRLDGEPAFSLEPLAALVPPSKAAPLAAASDEPTRTLGLVALAREADSAPPPALEAALEAADPEGWRKLADAVGQGAGGKGLALLLGSSSVTGSAPRDRQKLRTKWILDQLRAKADPRAADALARYLDRRPEAHGRTAAALRLAELGDWRAVPTLAWRMAQDPMALYRQDLDPEYRRDDSERIACARLLADLAFLHPERREELRRAALAPVRAWVTTKPQPHANGLRFFARADAREVLPLLRSLANPSAPLPRAGEQAFPPSFATAQSALRYLGAMKDARSYALLEGQLARRPAKVNATMEALLEGGNGVMGMTLRALAVGSAQGFAEWGDARAYPLLVKFIEDPLNNEQAKIEAGFALADVATDAQMDEIAAKVRGLAADRTPKAALERATYVEALARRPGAARSLADLLVLDLDPTFVTSLARALGAGPLTAEATGQLRAKLGESNLRVHAALALLLGGNADDARVALASFASAPPTELEQLKVVFVQSGFEMVRQTTYESGALARWAANADAASHVLLRGEYQGWLRSAFARGLQQNEYDSGPHSLTRTQLQGLLRRDAEAKDGDAKTREGARRLLAILTESRRSP